MKKASTKWMLFATALISIFLVTMWTLQYRSKDHFKAKQLNTDHSYKLESEKEQPKTTTTPAPLVPHTQPGVRVKTKKEVKPNPVEYYCNFPNSNDIFKMQEGNGQKGWKLKQVQIVIRHGDRAPLNLNVYHKFRTKNRFCNIHSNFYSDTLKLVSNYRNSIMKDQNSQHLPYFAQPLPEGIVCSPGQLTVIGALQHLHNGLMLREAYIRKHKLVDPATQDKFVYVRSTHVRRTFQSAVAFLYGFLPNYHLQDIPITFTMGPTFCEKHCVCPIVKTLEKKVKKTQYQNYLKRQRNNPIIKNISRITGIGDHTGPLMDSLVTGYICKQIPLPCNENGECVELSELNVVMNEQEYLNRVTRLESPARNISLLQIQPFLENITNHMKQVVEDSAAQRKAVLYSGHDLTLAPLIQALGLPEYRWPRLASRLVFELWQATDGMHFVKILFNGVDVTNDTAFCPGKNKPCSYNSFMQFQRDIGKYFGFDSRSSVCKS
uniref:2-phosphoxylose phosphatase 1 n=1 Tax=Ciona intestinalis TaxID=7719 RepID=F6UBS8_CIOIN|nr:2-phosphoxylose phosphatase 1 isoform X1 [Ciona intestinalis]|eukprot:XP_002126983.1 2-phosphoxylose phosphatase 1 isoform X1 [Ciona intestinalis]